MLNTADHFHGSNSTFSIWSPGTIWDHWDAGSMVFKDFLRQMCILLENRAYFGDGDGFNSRLDFHMKKLANPYTFQRTKIISKLHLGDKNFL